MLCNGGTLNGKRILGRKTVDLMTANRGNVAEQSGGDAARKLTIRVK
jgi:hypothetical protein